MRHKTPPFPAVHRPPSISSLSYRLASHARPTKVPRTYLSLFLCYPASCLMKQNPGTSPVNCAFPRWRHINYGRNLFSFCRRARSRGVIALFANFSVLHFVHFCRSCTLTNVSASGWKPVLAPAPHARHDSLKCLKFVPRSAAEMLSVFRQPFAENGSMNST